MPTTEHPTVPLTEAVPAPSLPRRARLALTTLVLTHGLLGAFTVLVVALGTGGPDATLDQPFIQIVAVVLLVACAVAEVRLPASAPFGAWALQRAGLGVPARMALRGLVVGIVVAAAGPGRAIDTTLLVAASLVPLVAVAAAGLADLLRRVRQLPVMARGLDVPVVQPPLPRSWVAPAGRWPMDTLVLAAAVVAGGMAAATNPGTAGAVVGLVVVAVIALVPGLAACTALARSVGSSRRVDAGAMSSAVEAALAELRPDLALYYAGPADALYQVTMWLPAFERLADQQPGRRAVVLLRNPDALAAMPPTSLPVVCVERGNALLQLQWPDSLRLACYVSNASGNIHLLRDRALRHVFIGHGDSDKTVSTGRYAKVYDEIWEAGPAGRSRWRTADVGVADADVVEVGAPFLDPPAPRKRPRRRVTIAYTPTWEGVADDADATSLGPCGEAVVARLLAAGVRVSYRPHPLAGTRDRRVAQSHLRVLAALGLGERDGTVPVVLDASTDPMGDAVCGHVYAPARVCTVDQVLTAADAAVTDISAALSQVVAAGLPVAVTDPTGQGLRVDAAYPVGPDGAGVESLVAAAGGADPLAAARARLRSWLFGDDPADGRFVAAVEAALTRRTPARERPDSGPAGGR